MMHLARSLRARCAPCRHAAVVVLLVLLSLPSLPARADALARLQAFMAGAQSGQTEFTQQVSPRDGKAPPPVSGHLAFQRPGLFRWESLKPYHQLIVADGQKVWLWDPDLQQVTVKPQGKALGASPAALLSGNNQRLSQDFQLYDRGNSEGLDWVEAIPRSNEVGFESIRLGFAGSELQRMDLRDSFGQLTRIRFTRFLPLAAHDGALFRFATPPGADEIRE